MKIYLKKIITEWHVDQKMILDYLTAKEKDTKCMFYINVPKDRGKTFFYKALIHYIWGIWT